MRGTAREARYAHPNARPPQQYAELRGRNAPAPKPGTSELSRTPTWSGWSGAPGNGRAHQRTIFCMPSVSVVIPTLHRPKLVMRAIASVLEQTHKDIEIIVVVDGPDEETITVVRSMHDPRLHVVVNPRSLTAAGARNVGADYATGDWIAFLDDDDEWLSNKLERQIAFASSRGPALVSCLSRVVTPIATYVCPRVIYNNSTPVDEYLFDHRSLFMGSSFIQTSSYFLPRRLFDKIRFNVESPHEDWDFILRLSKQAGARIETVPEVLVVLYFEEQRPSLASSTTWSASLSWIESVRSIITPRAYSGFCLGVAGCLAADAGAYEAFTKLLYRAVRSGSPRPWHVMRFLALWLIPRWLRRHLRGIFIGRSFSCE
jgi:glycosyltransferase involved in cell wall biosynthesis